MDSIYVSVCSYRDPLCTKTLESFFTNADNPQNVFIGLVQQNAETDADCFDVNVGVLSKYRNNIRIMNIRHLDAMGPTWARYLATTLYNGEKWFLQADSHVLLAKGWDTKAIKMINDIINGGLSTKPLLSHYVKTYEEYDQPNPDNLVPRICSAFFNDQGMLSFNGAHNI